MLNRDYKLHSLKYINDIKMFDIKAQELDFLLTIAL